MSTLPQRVIPNDNSFQIDFKPNPLIMDRRGSWTANLCEKIGFPDWRITDNRIDVINKAQNVNGYVSFNKLGFTLVDAEDKDFFVTKASEFLEAVLSLDGFCNPLHVKRLGVRSRFCPPFLASFDKLLKRYTTLYVNLKDVAMKTLGDNTVVTDAGSPWYFKDDHGDFKTTCGPMKQDQIATVFSYKTSTDLPEVGLYYDIDYYFLPQSELTVETILSKFRAFALAAWDRHQSFRNLILEG